MNLSCVKKCEPGDSIIVPAPLLIDKEYLVTHKYSDDFWPFALSPGYIKLIDVTTGKETFIYGKFLRGITKIIKKKRKQETHGLSQNISP